MCQSSLQIVGALQLGLLLSLLQEGSLEDEDFAFRLAFRDELREEDVGQGEKNPEADDDADVACRRYG